MIFFFSFLRNLFHIQCIKLPLVIWSSAGWDVSKDSYNCKILVKYEVRLFPPFRCHSFYTLKGSQGKDKSTEKLFKKIFTCKRRSCHFSSTVFLLL